MKVVWLCSTESLCCCFSVRKELSEEKALGHSPPVPSLDAGQEAVQGELVDSRLEDSYGHVRIKDHHQWSYQDRTTLRWKFVLVSPSAVPTLHCCSKLYFSFWELFSTPSSIWMTGASECEQEESRMRLTCLVVTVPSDANISIKLSSPPKPSLTAILWLCGEERDCKTQRYNYGECKLEPFFSNLRTSDELDSVRFVIWNTLGWL